MTAETGGVHEVYKYSQNFNLPLNFIIEDNYKSINTPTDIVGGRKIKNKYPNFDHYCRFETFFSFSPDFIFKKFLG